MKRKNIILASESPRRRKLLRMTGLAFKSVKSGIREKLYKGMKPEKAALHLARDKARAVSARFPDAVVIGADTIVVCGGKIFGRPSGRAQAVRMLGALSGRSHRVITAIAVVDGHSGMTAGKAVVTKVYFRPLTKKEIRDYVDSGEPFDKAGAYGIQGGAASFVRKIEGDYYSVVGLPLCELTVMLRKFGIETWDKK